LGLIDRVVANSFGTSRSGEVVFYPWGFGRGYVVASPQRRREIETGLKRFLILNFAAYLPILFVVYLSDQPLLLILALWPVVAFPLLLWRWTRRLPPPRGR